MSFKKTVQSSFSRAAGTYNDFSEVQQKAADDLVRLLLERLAEEAISLEANLSILDIGCGPGVLESRLQKVLPNMHYVGIDLSQLMTQEGKKVRCLSSSEFVVADMDFLPFQNNSFDVVVSSSTLQWSISDMFLWMHEVSRVLRSKGVFGYNLMVEGSLENFYRAYQDVCEDSLTLHRYPNQNLLESELKKTFQDASLEEKIYRKNYLNLIGFLRDVQKTGARSALNKGKARLTKGNILKIERQLRDEHDKIPIDYLFRFGSGKK